MAMDGDGSIENLVRRIIRSAVQEPSADRQQLQNRQEFHTQEDELNHRFNIPRLATPQVEAPAVQASTESLQSQYNSQENYGYTQNRRQRRRVPYSRATSSSRGRPAPKTRIEPPTLKEVILLPKSSWQVVPKYKKKAELHEKNFIVDSLQVERWWSESQLRNRIRTIFENKLLSRGIQVG